MNSSPSPLHDAISQAGIVLCVLLLSTAAIAQMRPDRPVRPRAPDRTDQSEGAKLVRAALELQGGADRLQAISTFESELDVTLYRKDGILEVSVHESWAEGGKLRTMVKEADRNAVETSWDGKFVYISTQAGKWEKMKPEEAGKDYRDIQENLRRVDRLLRLFTSSARFEKIEGRRLVRIHHNAGRPFEFVDPRDPKSYERQLGEEEQRLSILELVEVRRTDPTDPDDRPLHLYINDTAGHPSQGHIVGVAAQDVGGKHERDNAGEGAGGDWEILWFRDFQSADGKSAVAKSVLVPREIQIYRSPRLEGAHEIENVVKIAVFRPNESISGSFFKPMW